MKNKLILSLMLFSCVSLDNEVDFIVENESSGYFDFDETNLPVCGNGIKEDNEECDDGQETEFCTNKCKKSYCGDSIVNSSADEECDDGNQLSEDMCSYTCKKNRIVFITNKNYSIVDFKGSVQAIDAICQSEGSKKFNNKIFRAWISDDNQNITHRLNFDSEFKGYYMLPNNIGIVANNLHIFLEDLKNPIQFTINGDLVIDHPYVWSNTDEFGWKVNDDCNNWTSVSEYDPINLGFSKSMNSPDWTKYITGNCSKQYRLYCFDIGDKND